MLLTVDNFMYNSCKSTLYPLNKITIKYPVDKTATYTHLIPV